MSSQTEMAGMKVFDVTITETLEKTVTVEAEDHVDAQLIVNSAWIKGEYILDADNFTGVEFEAELVPREHTLDNTIDTNGGEPQMSNDNTALPLTENEHVKELLDILKTHGRDTSGLNALLGYVAEMEDFMKRADITIGNMKSQLDSIKEIQGHPFKSTLSNMIKTLERKAVEAKEQLSVIKNRIIGSCKNAVATFKEKGINALGSLASFFRIKDELKTWSKNIDSGIRHDDKAIEKIEAFSTEYHGASRHFKNMARVAVGKEPIDTEKKAGVLSKIISEPYKVHKAKMVSLKASVDKAVAKLEQFESRQAEKKAERVHEKKPSMLAKLAKNKERAEQSKRDTPLHERGKAQEMAV